MGCAVGFRGDEMAAIDLLFQFKRESERMHQMVLGILLTETRLLSRLVPLTGLQQPSANQLHWEPEARTYDLAAPLHQHPASAPAGRVLIELKLDGTLDEDQIEKQLNPSHFGPNDHLLYLLLGYSEITFQQYILTRVINQIAKRDGQPNLVDRVHIRKASHLIPQLADPELLSVSAPGRADVRDLMAAYRDLLLQLQDRVHHFRERPLSTWEMGDYFGLFAEARRTLSGKITNSHIKKVPQADGGFVGCSFCWTPIPGAIGSSSEDRLFLQLEDQRLCIKLKSELRSRKLRQRVEEVLRSQSVFTSPGPLPELTVEPGAMRIGSTMTVAYVDNILSDITPGLKLLGQRLLLAEQVIARAAAALTSQDKPA